MTPSTDWKEAAPKNEDQRLLKHAETLRDIQRRKAAETRQTSRALHAKKNLGVEAQFTVLPDLAPELCQGLFAKSGTYRAYVRYSNGSGARQHDKKPDVRGVAIKVLGVPGKKLIPGMEDAQTQDFLLIRSSSTPFRNADEFVDFVAMAEKPLFLLPKLLFRFGLFEGLSLLKKLVQGLKLPTMTLASTHYFSALPIQFGPYAARCALVPQDEPTPVPKGSSPDLLGEGLAERLHAGPVTYDFRVQFFVDETQTPIEDASIDWSEAVSPYVTVGRLVIPPQDAGSARGRRVADVVENLSFDPWHALVEHKPLGNMMRARNHAYRLSTQERKASPEPADDAPID
jgi:hypothetical protein